jgi:hypothetical protein
LLKILPQTINFYLISGFPVVPVVLPGKYLEMACQIKLSLFQNILRKYIEILRKYIEILRKYIEILRKYVVIKFNFSQIDMISFLMSR